MTAGTPIVAGLIGHGISGSLTPAMHDAEGKAAGLTYHYMLIDTSLAANKNKSLGNLISEAEAKGYAGLNITHPYKVQVVPFLDRLSPEALQTGAVNTIQFRDGKRIGHNTDMRGFQIAFLAELGDVAIGHVLLLGSGGAGAALAHALLGLGVQALSIFSKEFATSRDLALRLSALHPDRQITALSTLSSLSSDLPDGVVNATPMGMRDYPGMAISADRLRPGMWVADIVYFPLETELLLRAGQLECRTMSGAGMAIHQAAAAFHLITGTPGNAVRMAASFADLTTLANHSPKVQTECLK